jgi:very-short-patch-repair endonuclease
MASSLERTFIYYLRFLCPDLAVGMVEQYKIVPDRKWRWDFAWPEKKVAIECHGGLYSGGAHTRPAGVQRDMNKANAATVAGWRVLYFSTDDIEDDPEDVINTVRAVVERTA